MFLYSAAIFTLQSLQIIVNIAIINLCFSLFFPTEAIQTEQQSTLKPLHQLLSDAAPETAACHQAGHGVLSCCYFLSLVLGKKNVSVADVKKNVPSAPAPPVPPASIWNSIQELHLYISGNNKETLGKRCVEMMKGCPRKWQKNGQFTFLHLLEV